MKIEQFIETILHSRDQVHIWHLQTRSYAEHKALNGYYDDILSMFDNFVEAYLGRVPGRFSSKTMVFEFTDYESVTVINHFKDLKATIMVYKSSLPKEDADLSNMLDEILALLNKTLYLLTLA